MQLKLTGKKILLLCERLDIAQFLHVYLKFLHKQGHTLPDYQIINLDGLERMPAVRQKLLAQSSWAQVEKVILFADATHRIRSKMLEVYRAIDSLFALDKVQRDYYLFPGKRPTGRWEKGFLECLLLDNLCPKSAENLHPNIMRFVVEDFLFTVNANRGRDYKLANHSRHSLCAYLSGTEKFAGLRLAEAAFYGAFLLHASAFEGLKLFLLDL